MTRRGQFHHLQHQLRRPVKTGDDGTFTLDGLVPGFDYEINLATAFNSKGEGREWLTVGTARAEDERPVDIGDVKGVRAEAPGL